MSLSEDQWWLLLGWSQEGSITHVIHPSQWVLDLERGGWFWLRPVDKRPNLYRIEWTREGVRQVRKWQRGEALKLARELAKG